MKFCYTYKVIIWHLRLRQFDTLADVAARTINYRDNTYHYNLSFATLQLFFSFIKAFIKILWKIKAVASSPKLIPNILYAS